MQNGSSYGGPYLYKVSLQQHIPIKSYKGVTYIAQTDEHVLNYGTVATIYINVKHVTM